MKNFNFKNTTLNFKRPYSLKYYLWCYFASLITYKNVCFHHLSSKCNMFRCHSAGVTKTNISQYMLALYHYHWMFPFTHKYATQQKLNGLQMQFHVVRHKKSKLWTNCFNWLHIWPSAPSTYDMHKSSWLVKWSHQGWQRWTDLRQSILTESQANWHFHREMLQDKQ